MTPDDPKPPISLEEMRAQVAASRAERRPQIEAKRKQRTGGPVIDSQFLLRCVHNNEHGDGEVYSAMHQGQYINDKTTGEWRKWNGSYLELDVREESLSAVFNVAQRYHQEAVEITKQIAEEKDKEVISRLEDTRKKFERRAYGLKSERGRKNCLRLAADPMHGMDVTADKFDNDPYLVACQTGVIDLRTGEHRPGKLEDYITKASPFPWLDLEAEPTLFLKTCLDISADRPNLVEFWQRLFGYCLTGLITEQKIPVFTGRGRNGKGLLRNCIQRVMGPMAAPIPAEMLLDQGRMRSSSGPSPDMMGLKGLRLAHASETDADQKISASRVKLLTGGDPICARAGYDRYFTTFLPTHKLILLTNERPKIPPDDYAIWERIIEVPFDLSYVDREPQNDFERRRDPLLEEKIMATEGPAILAWLVRGAIWWMRDGLAPPPSIMDATAAYRRNEDLLQDWIDARCVLDPAVRTKSGDLFESFASWYEENVSKKPLSQHKFGKMMMKKFERIRSNYYYYAGIRLV